MGIKVVVDIFLLLVTIIKNFRGVEELYVDIAINNKNIINWIHLQIICIFIPKQFGFQTYLNRIVLFQRIVIKLKQEKIHKTLDWKNMQEGAT